MNILYVCQRVPYPPNKGEKLRSFHQIEYLLEQGHNVDVFMPEHSEIDRTYAAQLGDFGVRAQYSEKLGAPYLSYAFALLKGRSLSEAKFYRPTLQATFDQVLTENKYDALVLCASSLARYVFASKHFEALRRHTRLFMDFMDVDSDKWQQYAQQSAWPLRWVYQREAKKVAQLEKTVVQAFTQTFLISDKEVDLLQAHQPGLPAHKIHTLGNGIDTKIFTPKKSMSTQCNHYLFVGVMDYKPNVDAMLWFCEYVWPSIIKQNSQAELTIAGMSPTSKIIELGKQPSIHVTGLVDDIMPYFHAADVFVAPFQIARGVQNKILQAMACGLPVITSDLGLEGIAAKDGVELMVANTAGEYKSVIGELNDPEVYARLSRNSVQKIENEYSWDSKLQLLGELLAIDSRFDKGTNATMQERDCA